MSFAHPFREAVLSLPSNLFRFSEQGIHVGRYAIFQLLTRFKHDHPPCSDRNLLTGFLGSGRGAGFSHALQSCQNQRI